MSALRSAAVVRRIHRKQAGCGDYQLTLKLFGTEGNTFGSDSRHTPAVLHSEKTNCKKTMKGLPSLPSPAASVPLLLLGVEDVLQVAREELREDLVGVERARPAVLLVQDLGEGLASGPVGDRRPGWGTTDQEFGPHARVWRVSDGFVAERDYACVRWRRQRTPNTNTNNDTDAGGKNIERNNATTEHHLR